MVEEPKPSPTTPTLSVEPDVVQSPEEQPPRRMTGPMNFHLPLTMLKNLLHHQLLQVGTNNSKFLAWDPKQEKGKYKRPTFYYGPTPPSASPLEITMAKAKTNAQVSTGAKSLQKVPDDLGYDLLSHTSKIAKLLQILNTKKRAPKVVIPHLVREPFNETKVNNDTIVLAKDRPYQ